MTQPGMLDKKGLFPNPDRTINDFKKIKGWIDPIAKMFHRILRAFRLRLFFFSQLCRLASVVA